MKKIIIYLFIGILGGLSAIGIQNYFFHTKKNSTTTNSETTLVVNSDLESLNSPSNNSNVFETSNSNISPAFNTDFTVAAEKTVNAVVHVKNVAISRQPRNMMEYLRNGGAERKQLQGAGSGVIITADGYIVTNNHVIKGASEIEVTLNNNKSYAAEVIGTDETADIALLKIQTESETFDYLPFGDSDTSKIGEWVLAVGNPFNLTSTVTAGIISAKSRDLNEYDSNFQSFIQTDAAINPGNSGGALVNTRGELIGINTAITSQTGSYVGYAFAVPSNNAKKIVEDILEYGNVQKAILGIKGGTLTQEAAEQLNIEFQQGVYIDAIVEGSGAAKSDLKKGDIITKIDAKNIRKFTDLVGYLNSKRPNETLNIEVARNNKRIRIPVTLTLDDRYQLNDVGVEISNATKEDLARSNASYGVVITKALTPRMQQYNLEGIIITEIDEKKVTSVDDVRNIMKNKSDEESIMISLLDKYGEKKHFVFD